MQFSRPNKEMKMSRKDHLVSWYQRDPEKSPDKLKEDIPREPEKSAREKTWFDEPLRHRIFVLSLVNSCLGHVLAIRHILDFRETEDCVGNRAPETD